MFDKQWIIKNEDKNKTQQLADSLKISEMLARILSNRNFTPDSARDFLNPDLNGLKDPFLLPDMEIAVKRILEAAENGEKVTIFGDFDVDGMTSVAVLYHFLTEYMQINADYYIPERLTEGYGLSIDAVKKVCGSKPGLIVTVDCGTVSFEEAEYIKSVNVDLIITDHHQCRDEMPFCLAGINPMRKDSAFGFKPLAGVGVVFKLIQAVGSELGLSEEVFEYLPIVAVGTIGDSMPLLDENRIIVKNGLEFLKRGRWAGLNAILEAAQLLDKQVNSTDITYGIIPRLNAAGRMGSARRGVSLLLSDDGLEAEKLANELNLENSRRQAVEASILEQAVAYVEKKSHHFVSVAAGEGWHHGVTGIVASRLVERYDLPAFVISTENGIGRGSVRSVKGINVFKALESCGDILERYGGHEMAAGFSIKTKNIELLKEKLESYCAEVMLETEVFPEIEMDTYILPEEVNLKGVKCIEKLEPFGMGNPNPVFLCQGIELVEVRAIGDGMKHLQFTFSKGHTYYHGVAFNTGEYLDKLKSVQNCSCATRLSVNTWGGTEKVQLYIEDICDSVAQNVESVYNTKYQKLFTLKREDMTTIYKVLKPFSNGNVFTRDKLPMIKSILKANKYECSWFCFNMAIKIFLELGLLEEIENSYKIVDMKGSKVNLEQSAIYRALK
ncbi:MAG: single-stranded-DNA-specific exonuclease RecJ [Clostridiales bacterium]|jgi:single-stranded-DNA-specific exonuclease|nr:single-stranded-DNA-specific exonuclease RecJ [Clostridiales bacterium]